MTSIIVKLKADQANQLDALAQETAGKEGVSNLSVLKIIDGFSAAVPEDVKAWLEGHSAVQYVELDGIVTAMGECGSSIIVTLKPEASGELESFAAVVGGKPGVTNLSILKLIGGFSATVPDEVKAWLQGHSMVGAIERDGPVAACGSVTAMTTGSAAITSVIVSLKPEHQGELDGFAKAVGGKPGVSDLSVLKIIHGFSAKVPADVKSWLDSHSMVASVEIDGVVSL